MAADDGQAATADGHALAEFERLAGGKARPGDRQAPPAVFLDHLLEPTQSFNQSREHVQRSSLQVDQSDPRPAWLARHSNSGRDA